MINISGTFMSNITDSIPDSSVLCFEPYRGCKHAMLRDLDTK